jgi:hypothetical protein
MEEEIDPCSTKKKKRVKPNYFTAVKKCVHLHPKRRNRVKIEIDTF